MTGRKKCLLLSNSERFSTVAQCHCSHNTTVSFFSLQELSDEIEEYTQRFNTEDQLEWNLVLQEVAAFVEVFVTVCCVSFSVRRVFTHGFKDENQWSATATLSQCHKVWVQHGC